MFHRVTKNHTRQIPEQQHVYSNIYISIYIYIICAIYMYIICAIYIYSVRDRARTHAVCAIDVSSVCVRRDGREAGGGEEGGVKGATAPLLSPPAWGV